MSWKEQAPNLDRLLSEKRLSSASVARELGVDPSLVSRWRSGERVPDVENLTAMLELTGGSADAVLGLSGVFPPELVENVMREAHRLEAAAKQLQRAAIDARKPRK